MKEFLMSIKVFFPLINNDAVKENIEKKIKFLEEDIDVTLQSIKEKDAIKTHTIINATRRYADKYYRVRLNEICEAFINHFKTRAVDLKTEIIEIEKLKAKLQHGIAYSFSQQDTVRNPYPTYLFFSQRHHRGRFSGKSQRDGVAGVPIDEIAKKLKDGEMSPEYLRVNIYFAPFRGVLHPFVYNNRTWVVFSRAEINPTRIVPIIPTQDLLNRIMKLDDGDYPNAIFNEDNLKETTRSLLAGPKSY